MEDLRLFRHIIVLLGTVALICLMIGYFSQGWLDYDIRIIKEDELVDVKIRRGLWSTSGCVVLNFTEFTHQACGTITEGKMEKFIENSDQVDDAKAATKTLFENFTKLRILLMFGGVHAVVGLIFSLFLNKGRNILLKSRGFCCVYSWAASALLVMTAVVLQASKAYSYNNEIDLLDVTDDIKERIKLTSAVSWVMYISVTGSTIGIFMAVFLFVKLCRRGTSDLHKSKFTRSETEQTLEEHMSSEDDEEDEEDEQTDGGANNYGFSDNDSEWIDSEKKRREKADINVNYLSDIYM